MLEVRYIKETGKITAWAGSPELTGGHLKPKDGEEIIVLDEFNPAGDPQDYSIVDGKLVYTEPASPRDALAEIDEIKERLSLIEGGIK